MRKHWLFASFIVLLLSVGMLVVPAAAQEGQPPVSPQGLTMFTTYPSQVIGLGESVTFDLKFRTDEEPEIVTLETASLPDGWKVTFRGGGKTIQSVYVQPDETVSVNMRVELPEGVQAGVYDFRVIAQGEKDKAEMPLTVIIKEKLPPKLQFKVDLPTLRGTPSTTFRYSVVLKNEGDEDTTVNLIADGGNSFLMHIKYAGKEITSLPIEAGSSKTLSVEAEPVGDIAAGEYPFTLKAQSDTAETTVALTAQVTGRPDLQVTTPEGVLSAQATAGKETPLKIVIRNNGSAPARDVELTSSNPSGWKVTFDPARISEIPVGNETEVTVTILPAEQALAGDYVLTLRAKPADASTASADFRITVTTSTLWGLVGVVLIAVAVGVVGMAVSRFGRR